MPITRTSHPPRPSSRRSRAAATFAILLSAFAVASVQGTTEARADGPGSGAAWVVSVGDSFISGEAGRWAGNTNDSTSKIDAGGSDAYWDNSANTGEVIARCHRSESAPIHLGGGVNSKNLACSGSETTSAIDDDDRFKPGLDFYNSSGRKGQALQLQEFATTHNVKMVAVSIGGNNFGFADIVQTCVTDFLTSPTWWKDYCKDDDSVTKHLTDSNVDRQVGKIVTALKNVRTAMSRAGYADSTYRIVVQDYPSPLTSGGSMRYAEGGFSRQRVGGCGFWNADASWTNSTLLPKINGAVARAVDDANLTNTVMVHNAAAFTGRRLCESSVGLLEEEDLASWRSAGAVDRTEWVNQIRTLSTVSGPYFVQESIHPDHWGQLALRNCLRQAFNGGAVRGGTCARRSSTGLNSRGEPNMSFTPA